jgi:hypothetical protein
MIQLSQEQVDCWADALGHRSDLSVFTEIAEYGAWQASRRPRIIDIKPINSEAGYRQCFLALDDTGKAWVTSRLPGAPTAFDDWSQLPELPSES